VVSIGDPVCISVTTTAEAGDQSGLKTCNVLATRRLLTNVDIAAGAIIPVIVLKLRQSPAPTVSRHQLVNIFFLRACHRSMELS